MILKLSGLVTVTHVYRKEEGNLTPPLYFRLLLGERGGGGWEEVPDVQRNAGHSYKYTSTSSILCLTLINSGCIYQHQAFYA